MILWHFLSRLGFVLATVRWLAGLCVYVKQPFNCTRNPNSIFILSPLDLPAQKIDSLLSIHTLTSLFDC